MKRIFRFLVIFSIIIKLSILTLTPEPKVKIQIQKQKPVIKRIIKKPLTSRNERKDFLIIEKTAIITFYCGCFKCTRKYPWDKDYLLTASGVKATPYHTVALPESYPFETIVKIEDEKLQNYFFVNEDRGGAIKEIDSNTIKIDIFVSSHEEALALGKLKRKVKLIVPFH